jgi:glycosyltransferase involved in cell wall biosynthesis
MGKGAAMRSLFEYAKKLDASIAVMIDGDGQFDANEIPLLLNMLQASGADIIIGNRQNGSDMPLYRRIGNNMIDNFVKATKGVDIRDTQSGFRAYRNTALDLCGGTSNGFGADSEIVIKAFSKGLKVLEVPVSVRYNTGGRTSSKDPITHAMQIVFAILRS